MEDLVYLSLAEAFVRARVVEADNSEVKFRAGQRTCFPHKHVLRSTLIGVDGLHFLKLHPFIPFDAIDMFITKM